MKFNLSIECNQRLKQERQLTVLCYFRLSTPSVSENAHSRFWTFFLTPAQHSRKDTIVISGWKGLISPAKRKGCMNQWWRVAWQPIMRILLELASDKTQFPSIRYITPVRLMSPSFLGKHGKLAWIRTRPIPASLLSSRCTLIQYWTYSPLATEQTSKPNKMIPADQYFFFFFFNLREKKS